MSQFAKCSCAHQLSIDFSALRTAEARRGSTLNLSLRRQSERQTELAYLASSRPASEEEKETKQQQKRVLFLLFLRLYLYPKLTLVLKNLY